MLNVLAPVIIIKIMLILITKAITRSYINIHVSYDNKFVHFCFLILFFFLRSGSEVYKTRLAHFFYRAVNLGYKNYIIGFFSLSLS